MATPARRHAARLTILLPMLVAGAATLSAASLVRADDKPAAHHLGDHPAVVVQRLQRSAGYDYASKFYPHPAHLYLLPASPDEMERMHAAAKAATIDATPEHANEPHGPVAQR